MPIRKFQEKDAKQISKIIRENHEKITIKDYPEDVVKQFIISNDPEKIINKAKKRDTYVYYEGSKIYGVAALEKNEIKNMYVDINKHKKNIGRRLLKKLENLAKKRKIKELIVNSSFYAESFYRKMGYVKDKIIEDKLNNLVFRAVLMKKKL